MEPKLIRKDIEYQKKTLIIVSILVAGLFIGGSFSLLSSSDETEEVVSFKTGNFNLEVATEGTLNLEGELPKSYDEGFKSNDITLTLTNKGSLDIGKYEVKLEGDTGTNLDVNYIRYSISEDDGKTYLSSKLLGDTNNIIYTGYNLKDTKVLKVKLWIDEGAGENALKKSYNGNINVELYQNEDTLVDVVKSKLVSNYSGSEETFEGGVVAVNNNGELYHEEKDTEIREYRYSGENVNNYVTFNNELWRIIGIFKDETGEEHVKIVRDNVLTNIFPDEYTIEGTTYKIKGTESNLAYWNMDNSNKYPANWSIAGLQYWLNTKQDENAALPSKGYLAYLDDDSINMIEETKYYLGNVTNSSDYHILDTPEQAYVNERAISGCIDGIGSFGNTNQETIEKNNDCRVFYAFSAFWTGKIALLYPSDIGFSSNANYWNASLSTPIKSWLKMQIQYSLLSPASNSSVSLTQSNADSTITGYGSGYSYAVLPTLYLKSNVKIIGGTGEENNPYILTME